MMGTVVIMNMLANGDTPPTLFGPQFSNADLLRVDILLVREKMPLQMEEDGIELDFKAIREEEWKEILAERAEEWREPPKYNSSAR